MNKQKPERVGPYELISLLGEGGMAEVYLALLRGPAGFRKLEVIKRIRPQLAWDEDFVAMFLNEAKLAARLNHPNVIQTRQIFKAVGTYHLAMEFLDGQPLSAIFERLTRKAIPIEEHLWILSQILSGLHYAHCFTDYDGRPLQIVHRDVCPANVFVTYDGDVKLLDFGIAKVVGAASVTRPGTIKGRFAYCAPEQVQGGRIDARTDIFSTGVMLWEALMGRRMARRASAGVLARERISGLDSKARPLRADLPPALVEICQRALALNPADRYPTAISFQKDIDAYLATVSPPVGRAHIAARLRGRFDADREGLRKQIEAALTVPAESAEDATFNAPEEASTAVQVPLPRAKKSASLKSNRRTRFLGLGVSVGVAIVAITAWRTFSRSAGPRDLPALSAPSRVEAGRATRLEADTLKARGSSLPEPPNSVVEPTAQPEEATAEPPPEPQPTPQKSRVYTRRAHPVANARGRRQLVAPSARPEAGHAVTPEMRKTREPPRHQLGEIDEEYPRTP